MPSSPNHATLWPIRNGGIEALLYCAVLLYFAAAGAGAWSVDNRRASSAAADGVRGPVGHQFLKLAGDGDDRRAVRCLRQFGQVKAQAEDRQSEDGIHRLEISLRGSQSRRAARVGW